MQMMRSDKLGYNAPIEFYDHKYYRYAGFRRRPIGCSLVIYYKNI